MQNESIVRPRPSVEAAARAIAALDGVVAAARVLGVPSYQRVQGWVANGIPVAYCAVIEAQTGGAVTRRDMYPEDWRRIWPELAESEEKQPGTSAHQAQGAINSEAKEGAHA